MTSSVEGRPLEERDLITSAKDGDTAAFGSLVLMHQEIALRVAYLVLRDAAEAEDVTQDAFIKAHRSLHRFRPDRPFRPWILKIVRNEALNRVRSRGRIEGLALRAAHEVASGDAAPSPETELLAQEEHNMLLAMVDNLPPKHRDVITHRYLLDLSEQETAAVLGVPIGTVKSRGSRAIERLRVLLDEIENKQ